MSVIDLKKFSGLALSYDGRRLVAQEGGIDIGSVNVMKIDEMRPQLLNPDLSCPVIFYSVFADIDRKSVLRRRNLQFDVFVVPQNLAGIEYVKTKGVRVGSQCVLLELVHGFLTIIMQSNRYDSIDGELKSMMVKLKRGDKYVVPPHTDFILVNTRQTTAVMAMMHSTKTRVRNVFDDTRGGAKYIIRKNARQEIVQNPHYRKVNHIRSCKPDDLYKYFGLTAKTPVFKQILRKYDRFRWLHDSSKIDWDNVPHCS